MAGDHPHRRRNVVILVLAVLGALLVGFGITVVLTIDTPGPASVSDALDRFHDEGRPPMSGGDAGGSRPAEGVYLYAGQGEERLSFPPLHQEDGARMPGTVTYASGGCWVFRLDYNAEHWQDWRYCPTDRGLAEMGGRTHHTWDIGVTTLSNLTEMACRPPALVLPPVGGLELGDRARQRCTGENSEISGTLTSAGHSVFRGVETLTIGGVPVDAYRFSRERTLTGAQTGEERLTLWLRDDGLLLRMERAIEAHSGSPIGDITYHEDGSLELTGLDPRV